MKRRAIERRPVTGPYRAIERRYEPAEAALALRVSRLVLRSGRRALRWAAAAGVTALSLFVALLAGVFFGRR